MILDERIAQELRKLYKSLQNEGKLLSNEQLEKYYSTFRSRFGPDKLKNLDGEALLNLMHDFQNRDILVYRLEFKDDDEFPSKIFGSISGGSSFKFGLFRKKETGVWTSGAPSNPVELSVEQAIELARWQCADLFRDAVETALPEYHQEHTRFRLQLHPVEVRCSIHNAIRCHCLHHSCNL